MRINMNVRLMYPIAAILLASCTPEKGSDLKDAWNESNNPVIMMAVKNEFETNFSKLPLAGRPDKMPWSDHYWPTYHGGITYRWNDSKTKNLDKVIRTSSDRVFAGQLDDNENLQKLRSEVLGYSPYTKEQLEALSPAERTKLIATLSPAEKLDIYRGEFDYPTVKEERKRTGIFNTLRTLPTADGSSFVPNLGFSKESKIPTWYGICHAWAPATILFDEPGPITVASKDGFQVPMAGSDIKAFMAYMIDKSPEQQRTKPFLAERCNNDLGDESKAELWKIVEGLQAGRMDIIDAQVALLEDVNKIDLPSRLRVASFFYNFAPSAQEARLGFQKFYERQQNSFQVGSSTRQKLGLAYSESLVNLEKAGTPEGMNFAKLKEGISKVIEIPACNDTNAGAFHLVITNIMGIQKKTFIFDIIRDYELWNQAAASYSSKALRTYTGDQITADAAPGTVKEVLIESRLLYTTEEMPGWERFGDGVNLQKHHVPVGDTYTENGRNYKALRYKVELDVQGNIIGGSWVSNSRPDFIWGTGNFIWAKEYSDIEDLYYESIQ
jgi:hypothetical protein